MTDKEKPKISLDGLPPLEDIMEAAGMNNQPEVKNVNLESSIPKGLLLVAFNSSAADYIIRQNPKAYPFVMGATPKSCEHVPNYLKNLSNEYPTHEIAVIYKFKTIFTPFGNIHPSNNKNKEEKAHLMANLIKSIDLTNTSFIEAGSDYSKKIIDKSIETRSL